MPSIEALIDRQLRRWEMEKRAREAQPAHERAGPPVHPVITVSRERGCGGGRVAALVARQFDYTLLHHDVIDRICRSSGIRRSIVAALDEHARSQVDIWCDAMLGQRYADADDYVRMLLQTIRSVAELGGAVVVGRGSNFVIGPERGLHVRVVAPREWRIRRLVEHARMNERSAAQEVAARDRERAEFIRKVYSRDIADPTAYDLVINTGAMAFEAAANVIEAAAREKFGQLPHAIPPLAEMREQW